MIIVCESLCSSVCFARSSNYSLFETFQIVAMSKFVIHHFAIFNFVKHNFGPLIDLIFGVPIYSIVGQTLKIDSHKYKRLWPMNLVF